MRPSSPKSSSHSNVRTVSSGRRPCVPTGAFPWLLLGIALAAVLLCALCRACARRSRPEAFTPEHDINGTWGGGDVIISLRPGQVQGVGVWQNGLSHRPNITIEKRSNTPNQYFFRFPDTPAYNSTVTAISARELTLVRVTPRLGTNVWTRERRGRPRNTGACTGDVCSKAACYAAQVETQGAGPYVRSRGACTTNARPGAYGFRDAARCKKSQGLWKACFEEACGSLPEAECRAAAASYDNATFRQLALKAHNCMRKCGGQTPGETAELAWAETAEASARGTAQRVCASGVFDHQISLPCAPGVSCSENLSGFGSVLESAFEFYNEVLTDGPEKGHYENINQARRFMGCAGASCAPPLRGSASDPGPGNIRNIVLCHYN